MMNYGYQPQPYTNPYSQFNYQGFPNQIQPLSQSLQQSQQNVAQQSNNILQGWYVDGFDVIKSINADMSGNAMFFPSTDGKEIYKKQLDVNTGKSFTCVYKIENKESEDNDKYNVDLSSIQEQINNIKNDLSKELSEIKDMVLDSLTSPSKKVGDK